MHHLGQGTARSSPDWPAGRMPLPASGLSSQEELRGLADTRRSSPSWKTCTGIPIETRNSISEPRRGRPGRGEG